MELISVDISGYKSLAGICGLPIERPTILTGHNDAGKSTVLAAIGWLLGRGQIKANDFTFSQPRPARETELVNQITVTGLFRANEAEQKEFEIPENVQIRRGSSLDAPPVYQVLRNVPQEPSLRGISEMKLSDLKSLCQLHNIAASGSGTMRDSWQGPLKAYADAQNQTKEWDSAPKRLINALPDFLIFSSTDEPDPRSDAREALAASFDRHIADPELADQVKKIETELTQRLTADASRLRDHIRERCPELQDVSVLPRVSMRQGFVGVDLTASRTQGEDVDLHSSGAGRRRLVTLAIWEWVKELLGEQPQGADSERRRSLIVAYDEPDTHLDYSHQRELMELFRAQCEVDGVRMVVATHSLNLIDRVDISNVVHLRLANERTVMEQLLSDEDENVERYLADVSLAMGLRNSTLLHERCFAIVEGATEQQSFPLLFRLSQGLPMQSVGVALVAADGNEGALKVAGLLKKRQRSVALVLDRDTARHDSTKKMFRPDRLRKEGFDPDTDVHYIGTNELEDLFTNEQWASAGNSHWTRDDGQQWVTQDIENLRNDGKFSDKLLTLFRESSSQGPWGKTDLVTTLARDLTSANEVPEELDAVFAALTALATG